MMRIAIDARALEEHEATGVARYLRNILHEWNRLAPTGIEIMCYTRRPVNDIAQLKRLAWRIVPGGPLSRKGLVWQNTTLLWALRRDQADMLWCPFNLAPPLAPCPVVLTLHDLSFLANPLWFRPYERIVWGNLARISARRSIRVLTDSDFSRDEIVRHVHIKPNHVIVTPLAVDPTLQAADDHVVAALRERLNLHQPYVLFVGAMFARRNIPVLLDGFGQVSKEFPDWQLLLVGPNRYTPPFDLPAAITEHGLTGRVRHIPYIDEQDLAALYTGALSFVYPSSYEGFGLPVLEAMACGVPVITGNATSLPEVAGDAAILVDPHSPRLLAAALVLAGSQTALRMELRRRGLAQAAHFSWRKTAAITLDTLVAATSR